MRVRVPVWSEHPGRRLRRGTLAALDPRRDAHEIYRTLVLLDLPLELKFGLNLAFYRTFASPRIAALLTSTGEMAHDPDKRAFDTGLIIYEIITNGFAHQRSRRVIAALNRMHGRWPIAQEDYRYVLSAFVVAPTRFVDQWGWRELTAHERMATASFYRELGHWMGIHDVPETYEGFSRTFDDYEERHLAPSGHGEQLMALTQRVIAEQLPRVLRPVARPLAGRLTAALIDQRLATCLGLRPASSAERVTARILFELRGAVERRRPPRSDPSFTPGMPVIAHPGGYDVDDLGVDAGWPQKLRNN